MVRKTSAAVLLVILENQYEKNLMRFSNPMFTPAFGLSSAILTAAMSIHFLQSKNKSTFASPLFGCSTTCNNMKKELSLTPETDAAIIRANGAWTFELKEAMQRLERERDEAREASAAIQAREAELVLAKDRIAKRAEAIRCELVEKDKQLEAMREAIKEAYGALSDLVNLGSLELPQRRDAALLVGHVTLAKLQLFLKTKRILP